MTYNGISQSQEGTKPYKDNITFIVVTYNQHLKLIPNITFRQQYIIFVTHSLPSNFKVKY